MNAILDILRLIPIWAVPLTVLLWFLATLLFRWLWNTTMPQVFGLPEITFWVAFRLLLLLSFLGSGTGSLISFGLNSPGF